MTIEQATQLVPINGRIHRKHSTGRLAYIPGMAMLREWNQLDEAEQHLMQASK